MSAASAATCWFGATSRCRSTSWTRVGDGLLRRRADDHQCRAGAGITGGSPAAAYAGLPAVAYWENLFPGAAGGGLTATQAMTRAFMLNGPDWITALYDMDTSCSPACSIFGPYAYFAEQYDSLAAISSIGRSNYHAMILTLRKRFSDGMQFDINYTLSKSKDMGSQVERGSGFGNFANGGSSGFLINSFDPELNYGTSDFDVRHQINANWLAELPFGQGSASGGAGNALNALDWRLVGRRAGALDERLPVQRLQLPLVLDDQLERSGQRHAGRSGSAARNRDDRERGRRPAEPVREPDRGADVLPAPAAGRSRRTQPVPRRRLLHHRYEPQQGFKVGIADHRLRFRWDVFNVTNTPKFDVGQLTITPDIAGFGRYNGTLATCDAQAGRCMQFALRYEF